MPRTSIATTKALAKASPRARFWKIGQTEEGRDQVVLAIADEASIQQLDKYRRRSPHSAIRGKNVGPAGARADQKRPNRFTGSTAVFTRLKRAGLKC